MNYLHKQWDKLNVYTTDGRLRIDNNLCENAVRPFVMGRKAWLFATSVDGAKASANLYSLVETAKANGREPHSYFQHALTKLQAAQSQQDMKHYCRLIEARAMSDGLNPLTEIMRTTKVA